MGVVLEPTNMFCWDTGSNTCSSQWLDLVHIKPPFFWRLLSVADLHGTPLHTALSGTSVWQKLPCPFLQCTWPVKTDMKARLCPSSRVQHSTQFTLSKITIIPFSIPFVISMSMCLFSSHCWQKTGTYINIITLADETHEKAQNLRTTFSSLLLFLELLLMG